MPRVSCAKTSAAKFFPLIFNVKPVATQKVSLRLEGETEIDRLERLMATASKWVGGSDNGFGQKEVNRLKAELVILKARA